MIFGEETGFREDRKIIKKIATAGAFKGTEIVHPKTPERTLDTNKVKEMAEKHRNAGGKVVYEIGFGGLFCANLGVYDLAVGVDPMNSNDIKVSKDLEEKPGSERLFFNQPVSELPDNVPPDFVVMVAPSPETIEVIMDELESKVDKRTRFAFFIENQSAQAVDGRAQEMLEDLRTRMSGLRKRVSIDNDIQGLDDDFSEYLENIGLRQGGVLKTKPWQGSGEWMVLTAV